MAQIILNNLDDQLVERLKSQASRHGRSLEAEVQRILESSSVSVADFRQLAAECRSEFPGPFVSDSVEILREDRSR